MNDFEIDEVIDELEKSQHDMFIELCKYKKHCEVLECENEVLYCEVSCEKGRAKEYFTELRKYKRALDKACQMLQSVDECQYAGLIKNDWNVSQWKEWALKDE